MRTAEKVVSICCFVAVLLLAQVFFSSVRAEVITFDDVDTSAGFLGDRGITPMPSQYGNSGLTWTGKWAVINNTVYDSIYGNILTFPSSPNAVINGGDQTVTLTSSTPFNICPSRGNQA